MALRLIEGWELGEIESIGQLEAGTAAVATVNVRSGSGARYLELTNLAAVYKVNEIPWDAANDTLYLGFAVRFEDVVGQKAFVTVGGWPTSQTTDDSYVNLSAGPDGIVHVIITQDYLSTTGTFMFDSSPGIVTANTWHYIEIKFLCHESAGAVEVWIDGTSIGSFAGDTQAEATAGNKPDLVTVYFGISDNASDLEIDDLYLLDTNTTSPETGTSPNIARLGDIVIEALAPTSDAVPNNFTRSAGANNWELVDEIPPDDNTTYVESSTVAHEDRYGLSNRVHTGTVVGVSVQVQAEKTSANARTLNIGLTSNTGATVDAQPENMFLINGVYATGQKTYDRDFHDEVTAADWTTAKVNALETSTVVV